MSALNCISSSKSSRFCLHFQESKNYYSTKINFTPAFLAKDDSSLRICNQWKLNFKFSVPAHLTLELKNVVEKVPSLNEDSDTHLILSSLVATGTDVISDVSSSIRQAYAASEEVCGTENPAVLNALGFTTGFSLVLGGLTMNSGIQEAQIADKISDTMGKVLAYLKIVKGAAFAVGGAIFIPVRALSLAALSTTAKIVSTIAGTLGTVGGAFFSIGSFFSGISLGISLNEHRVFRSELDAILQDATLNEEMRPIAALQYLKNLARVGPEEKLAIQELLQSDPEYSGLSSQEKAERTENQEKLLCLKKEAFLKRVTSDECLKDIVEKEAPEAGAVIAAVLEKSREKIILSSLAMALVAISLSLTVASFVFISPLATAVIVSMGLAVSFGWLGLDGYDLIQEFKSSQPGRYDKLWIFLSTIIAAVTLSLVFYLSGGIAPVIVASVLGLIWVSINAACYYRLYTQTT